MMLARSSLTPPWQANDVVFAMEYDVSGVADADIVPTLKTDWAHLVGDLKLTSSPAYLHHRGNPVVIVVRRRDPWVQGRSVGAATSSPPPLGGKGSFVRWW